MNVIVIHNRGKVSDICDPSFCTRLHMNLLMWNCHWHNFVSEKVSLTHQAVDTEKTMQVNSIKNNCDKWFESNES